ncbi:MAG: HAD family hydrolase [Phycisphaerae bacterium]
MTRLSPSTNSVDKKAGVNSDHQLIVCDLDGTLISRDHKLNTADIDALAKARQAGVAVSICTGRSIGEALDIIKPLNLSGPGVFITGAAICDLASGATLHRQAIAPGIVRELITFFGNLGHAVLLLVDAPENPGPRYIMTQHGPVHAASEEWFLRNKMAVKIVDHPDDHTLSYVLRLGIVVDLPQSADMTAQLTRRFGSRINFLALRAPAFECHVIEVFAQQVDKWTGIQRLCALLNIDSSLAVPIGDDVNDVPMLRHATLSFAMGNAAPEIQRAAKHVTRSQSQAGVAAAVEAVLSGKLRHKREPVHL